MKRSFRSLLVLAAVLFVGVSALRAQWHTQSYVLHRGWNALWLPVDLTDIDVDTLGLPLEIKEIWRWNPNYDPATFTEDVNESITLEKISDWQRWVRGQPLESDLVWLRGNAAYLFKVDIPAGQALAWSITGRAAAPTYKWRTDGLNFYGFNVRSGSNTTFNQYFQGSGLVDFGTEVFQYPGNDLAAIQPTVLGNPRQSVLKPQRAYWIRSNQYASYAGPVSVLAGSTGGLTFDDLRSEQNLQVRNLSAVIEPTTVTLQVISSAGYPSYASAPANLRSGLVKLALRDFDPDTGDRILKPLVGDSLTLEMDPAEIANLRFLVDWEAMSYQPGDRFESLLHVTDSRNMIDFYLPVVAEAPVRTGLWMGEATITHVRNQFYDPEAEDAHENGMYPVRQAATLRLLVHFDEAGNARLLSQAYLGHSGTGDLIVSTAQGALDVTQLESAIRLSSAHLPPQTAYLGTSTGSELSFAVHIPFDSPHNPFVHQYHPDHDNIANDGSALAPNVEAFDIDRAIGLIFADEPLPGHSVGWGTTVLGGTFTESLSGLHRYGLEAQGTFFLRRISDVSDYSELP